jgi:hypothetical protein
MKNLILIILFFSLLLNCFLGIRYILNKGVADFDFKELMAKYSEGYLSCQNDVNLYFEKELKDKNEISFGDIILIPKP